ncbi:hypothetical protein GLYMA_13G234650v4 [Glycine max]|nr:hypothetical protein GLYMA_13G234650v4 [Glycine max]KAH1103000.1 hypothetical protein GYH30_037150 [Glycine max]
MKQPMKRILQLLELLWMSKMVSSISSRMAFFKSFLSHPCISCICKLKLKKCVTDRHGR